MNDDATPNNIYYVPSCLQMPRAPVRPTMPTDIKDSSKKGQPVIFTGRPYSKATVRFVID